MRPKVLTGAAALAVGDNAAEVPEARFAAVTFQAPDTRLAGALARGRITTSSIGAVRVAVAGTYKRGVGHGVGSMVKSPQICSVRKSLLGSPKIYTHTLVPKSWARKGS